MKSDTQLQRDVLDALDWEPSIDVSQIGVTAKDGVVTLSGCVPRYLEKMDAQRTVQSLAGVSAVANEIEVRVPGSGTRNDTDIAAAAVHSLEWHTAVPKERVKLAVRNGWITLEGNVDWQYQRAAAADAVSYLQGVAGVNNLITIAPQATPAEVRAKIEAAFKRSAEVDAQRVRVEAHDGTVTLHGKVSAWAERSEAERAAWSAPGVTKVDNRLTVGA
jgi:osmotically-inducible protein OsmY